MVDVSPVWSPKSVDITTYAGEKVRISFYHTAAYPTSSTGWYVDGVDFPTISPVIDDIAFNEYVPPPNTSTVTVTAHGPEEGVLTYRWAALDGGSITGEGAQVQFWPPSEYRFCPYRVRVAACSGATHMCSARVIRIYTRLIGDADGNGIVNVIDKVVVRNHFGQTPDHPDWDPVADVNCDGVVNVVDKVIVREYFGQSE